ncbi:MAG: hypothetical protein V4508_00445 [Pseudomonadota bacterium]
MILLRCAAFVIGALILMFAPPFALSTAAALRGLPSFEGGVEISIALGCIVLFASGFLFVGVAGHRLTRSPWKRITAAILLSFPLLSSLWVLLLSEYPILLSIMGPLLAFSCALFAAFVWPARGTSVRRRMRLREQGDTAVPGLS